VIIDLEPAGCDGEEWEGDGLTAWDESMLKDRDGKKIYNKALDMYQLGKLIVEAKYSGHSEEDSDLYPMGEKMQWERPAAMMMLEDICKHGCEHCGKFDTVASESSLTRPRGCCENSGS